MSLGTFPPTICVEGAPGAPVGLFFYNRLLCKTHHPPLICRLKIKLGGGLPARPIMRSVRDRSVAGGMDQVPQRIESGLIAKTASMRIRALSLRPGFRAAHRPASVLDCRRKRRRTAPANRAPNRPRVGSGCGFSDPRADCPRAAAPSRSHRDKRRPSAHPAEP